MRFCKHLFNDPVIFESFRKAFIRPFKRLIKAFKALQVRYRECQKLYENLPRPVKGSIKALTGLTRDRNDPRMYNVPGMIDDADVNKGDEDGVTPLFRAASVGNTEIWPLEGP